jgi:hypothetical protein
MKSGDLASAPESELLTLERLPSDSAEPASYDDEFLVQQQKIARLGEYYDQVVAELLALLNESHDDGELAPASAGEAH